MMFLANVAFHSPKGTAVERTNVRVIMNGLDEGQIDIDERGDLMVNQFHLKFLPNFQSFIFDEDNGTLVVEGSSDKIGGDYLVRIHPRTD